jgi:hypothetical protein
MRRGFFQSELSLMAALCLVGLVLTTATVGKGSDSKAAVHNIGPYPLEIISPRNNMDPDNRVRWAYPGVEYNIRASAIGGAYPYTWELQERPDGMTIQSSTGLILWPNPPKVGSPHTVTVRVTDASGSFTSVTWQIAVDPSRFIFVDTRASDSGDGTIASPFKRIADWWIADKDSTYAVKFIYYREGTYTMPPPESLHGGWAVYPWLWSLRLYNDYKPVVWLGYPGETVIMDMALPDANYVRIYLNHVHDSYFDNLRFVNTKAYAIQHKAGYDNHVFRRLQFEHLLDTGDGASQNQSFIRFLAEGKSATPYGGDFHVVQDCDFGPVDHGVAIKAYDTHKLLIEDNTFDSSDSTDAAIALKTGNKRPTVRGNVLKNIGYQGIGGGWNAAWWSYANPPGYRTDGLDICFNLVVMKDVNSGDAFIANRHGNADEAYVYRNTFIGNVNMRCYCSQNQGGPIHMQNNVIVNNMVGQDGNHLTYSMDSQYCAGCIPDESKIRIADNLAGFLSDNIVDSHGNLTKENSSYLGTHGWQISDSFEARGDLDGDGNVNVIDVQLAVNVVIETELDPMVVARADVNEDSRVDILDIQLIVNTILRK